jgi:glycosyltransferase involved in cell wall biosynthesis
VREDGTLCSGPSKACASCAGSQAQEPVFAARAVQVAAKLPWDASRLHRLYQRLPARLKSRIPSECNTVSAAQIQARQKNLLSLAKACSALVSPSRFLALLAEQHGFPKPVIIPHGVTPPTITPKERNYLLFLGTLAPHKGPLLVRDAWKLAGRPLPLRIVGPSGPDLLYLSKLQAEEPMPEPAVKNVWELLAGARALVLGSCWPENAPLVVLEAQSVGCPVVAPEIGGIPELLSEGWLYPPKNKEALAEAILKACTEQKQPDPPWSFERHLETILGLYARVAKR